MSANEEPRKGKKLTRAERIKLYKYRRLGYSGRRIGIELGRDRSVINRELKRNGESVDKNEDYIAKAHTAHEATHRRRSAASKRMRLKSEEIRSYVEIHLINEGGWSPEQIAGKLKLLGYKISAEAIYQWILNERPELVCYLKKGGKSRRRRVSGRKRRFKQPAAPKVSIELRPQSANDRVEIGHLEQDTMVSRKSKVVVMNVVDRKARKVFLQKVDSGESQVYSNALVERCKKAIPSEVIQTITQDNGSENANHLYVGEELNIDNYFCHPHCSPERGTVENRNGIVRRSLPKGTDFAKVSDRQLEDIQDAMNNTPMKLHGFKTPNEVWNEGVEELNASNSLAA